MIQCGFWSNDDAEICYYEHSRISLCGRYIVTTSVGCEQKVV